MAETNSNLSDDTIGYLEEVKKGKPRRYAMICKGPSVVSLVVYKKGSVEKYKKEAKESGKGQFYFGVVDGRGQEITFKLAREDGFDAAPVKTVVLKQFLNDAGLKFRPLFEIVDVHQAILDDSHPLTARFLALQPQALSACDAHPERVAEIEILVKSASAKLAGDAPELAEGDVVQLEQLLSSLAKSSPSTNPTSTPVENNSAAQSSSSQGTSPQSTSAQSTSPQSTSQQGSPSPAAQDELKAKLQAALGKLVAQLKEAIASFPDQKVKLLTPVAEIKKQLEENQLAEARQGLLAVGQLLKDIMSQRIVSAGTQGSDADGNVAQTNNPIVPSGTVDFMKCRLAWDAAKRRAHAELQKLETSILQVFQGNAAYAELAQRIRKIDSALELFAEDLSDLLDQAHQNTDPEQRKQLHSQAAQTATRFLASANSDAWIDQLQNNPFVAIDFKPLLTSTLTVLVKKLG